MVQSPWEVAPRRHAGATRSGLEGSPSPPLPRRPAGPPSAEAQGRGPLSPCTRRGLGPQGTTGPGLEEGQAPDGSPSGPPTPPRVRPVWAQGQTLRRRPRGTPAWDVGARQGLSVPSCPVASAGALRGPVLESPCGGSGGAGRGAPALRIFKKEAPWSPDPEQGETVGSPGLAERSACAGEGTAGRLGPCLCGAQGPPGGSRGPRCRRHTGRDSQEFGVTPANLQEPAGRSPAHKGSPTTRLSPRTGWVPRSPVPALPHPPPHRGHGLCGRQGPAAAAWGADKPARRPSPAPGLPGSQQPLLPS